MGTKDGSIIATIIATHMPRNDAAASGHVCPGIRIHAIDIVQPPGITMTSALVLVVMLPPQALLVAPLRRAIEPLIHAPQAVEAARVRGVGVIDDAVVERERADAGPLAQV